MKTMPGHAKKMKSGGMPEKNMKSGMGMMSDRKMSPDNAKALAALKKKKR